MKVARVARAVGLAVGVVLCAVQPTNAARPLLDQHQWDRYFALFARDSDVPWKTTNVRLDTYSSAPVALATYAVRPEDVIVAGHPRGHAVDVSHRKPVVAWRFSPRPGYRVEGNDVAVPLGEREGVFVVQARRGAAVQQVWINRSRIGLLSKAAPRGIVIYGCDLGSGKPLARMRVLFLVNRTLVTRYTDSDGLVRWDRASRPSFVLAEWGNSRAFLSLLPQAPVPPAITALRVDRSVVRSGDVLNVVGYARRLHGTTYERSGGYADLRVSVGSQLLAQAKTRLDDAGAFTAKLPIPSGLNGGKATVLAKVNGASAGTSVAIEAAGDLGLWLHSPCMNGCSGKRAIPIAVNAERHGQAVPNVGVAISVVRYPHIAAPNKELDASASWGATEVLNVHGRTDAKGTLRVVVPEPADGLPSTLGITAQTDGAQATVATRISVPNSRVALEVMPEQAQVDVGRGVAVNVHGFEAASGAPLTGFVHLRLSHGPNASAQTAKLDAHGNARVTFTRPQMGSDLVVANYSGALGEAYDANSVKVVPRALSDQPTTTAGADVHTDRARYRIPSLVTLDVPAPGARGSALISIDALAPVRQRIVRVTDGRVHGAIHLDRAEGDVRAAVAYVHDGALVIGSTPLAVDGPGHERQIDLVPDARTVKPGETAHIAVHDGNVPGNATTVVRLTDGVPSDSAIFDDAADVLAAGGVTTLVSASNDPPWHAWVTPSKSLAADFLADLGRRTETERPPALDASAIRVLYWRVVEHGGASVSVPMPRTPGHYSLSILRIYNDGDVGGASTVINVS